jgi:histidyl-tRNA synthetase
VTQKISGVKGMNDILSPDIRAWIRVESATRETFRRFGYSEIRTPAVEDTALFVRGVGEATDIVGKEMYTFEDKAGRSLTLRPEGTAPAARAYIEHAIYNLEPVTHWFYIGPMFRYERMKTGRYRQFWQIGAEAFGVKEPAQDVELMDMVVQLLNALDARNVSLLINSLGDDACRPRYLQALVKYLSEHRESLCADCRERLGRNPLRILDCKNEGCRAVIRNAPSVLEFLCEPCREHFAEVRRGLDALGHKYEVDPRMVRGLDYYTRTAFEFVAEHPSLGTASTVGGGGRYDKLVSSLGGPDVPAVGFALGLDRLCLLLSERPADEESPDLFLASADAAGKGEVLGMVSRLRREGLWVEFDPRGGSLKSQMKRADKSGARYALVLGEAELAAQSAELKPLRGGEPKKIDLRQLSAALLRA